MVMTYFTAKSDWSKHCRVSMSIAHGLFENESLRDDVTQSILISVHSNLFKLKTAEADVLTNDQNYSEKNQP